VGHLDGTGPGLWRPSAAWCARVHADGGGEIESIDAARGLCTVLPGIDE
jgi:hypothetical protein